MSVEISQRSAAVLPSRLLPPLRVPSLGRWRPLALAAAVLGAGLGLVAVSPLQFAYPLASARVALATATALAALVGVGLVLARPRGERAPLGAALGVLAASGALLAGFLALAPEARPPLAVRAGGLTGAALLALAPLVPGRSPTFTSRRSPAQALAVAALAFALACAVVAIATPVAVHLVGAALFAAAAVRLAAARESDPLRWLALGAICLAFARLAYGLGRPFPAELVHVGDLLRALGYGLLAVGAVRALRGHWGATAAAAERRRLARELHDGLAQELALIQRRAPALSDGADGRAIAAAAERAALEARSAIESLAAPRAEPFDRALAAAAERLVAGSAVQLHLRLAPSVQVEAAAHDHLLRIAREAIANAVRHARARTIQVELTGTRLSVRDDGLGFDPGARTGFGLAGMRDRAALIGAGLTVGSRPGGGTEVCVELP